MITSCSGSIVNLINLNLLLIKIYEDSHTEPYIQIGWFTSDDLAGVTGHLLQLKVHIS